MKSIIKSEYNANLAMKESATDKQVNKQADLALANKNYLDQLAKEKRQRNEQRISAFCKAAFWIIIGLIIAIGLKHFGVWL